MHIMPNFHVENEKVIRLNRDNHGMFEKSHCNQYTMPTQHRCTYGALFGKYYDVRDERRICGKPICSACLEKYAIESNNRCLYHHDKEEGKMTF